MATSTIPVVDVAVIGAGFAGLSCAGRLLNAFPEELFGPSPSSSSSSTTTVAILEARGRIGGRAFSLPFPSSDPDTLAHRFDLGASWLQGSCSENPFTRLIRGTDTVTALHDDFTPGVLYDAVEERRLTKEEILAAQTSARAVLAEAKCAKPKTGEADRPLSHDITMPSGMTTTEARAVRWFLHETEQLLATSFDVLSSAHWDDYAATCMVGPNEFVVNSIGAVAEKLAEYVKASPRATLHLNAAVSELRRIVDGDGGMINEVVCVDGHTIHARRIVCTIPLGVLKCGSVVFTPALTAKKQAAIKNIGFGVMDKVILEYDTCFWGEKDLIFGHASDTWGNFPWFVNLKRDTRRNALVCFIVGKAALEVEGRADDDIIRSVHSVLQAMFPGESSKIDGPKSFLITRWASDPFSRGSYAMYQVGSSAEDCREFEVPEWESTLFFAGEHMSWNEQGFVHGAIITGLKAADAIAMLDREF